MRSSTPVDVSGKWFDYVIVGAGTAGLALASRLSEDPSVTIVVIEAGEANMGDPKIMVPAQFGQTFTNPKYDWAFSTVKQKFSNDKELIWSRGKGLGGSSGLNFSAWVKPPANDIDAIERLGNPGWNWAEYMKYSRRSETFHPPAQEQMDTYPHTYEASFHGTSGPIHTTIPFHFHAVDSLFQETMVNKGLKSIKDPYGGDITGTWIANSNIDPSTWTRSYAATGYYLPAQDRGNLTVLTEATVTRIIFNDALVGQNLTATGVEFAHSGHTFRVHAHREVILSAGRATYSSVHLVLFNPFPEPFRILKFWSFQASARPDVLRKIGVEIKLELDGVGENVQEHSFMGVSYELAGSPETYDRLRDPAYAAEAMKLHAEGRGPHRMGITSFAYFPLSAATPEAAVLIDRAAAGLKASGELPPGRREQLEHQLAYLRDDSTPDLEIVAFPGFFTAISAPEPTKSYVTLLSVLNHPLSRGTIHAKSADPFENPLIDPHYFENFLDLEILVQHVKYIRTMVETEPFKSSVVREMDPGPECVTDEDIREYIKNTHTTTWHTVGSCSMLPREKQGVVDPELKVYGTNNLRIVDVSVVPIHIAAHTQATAYMIAEKATDIIQAASKANQD